MPSELIHAIPVSSSGIEWSAWVTAIASLVLAVLTFIYVRLTKRIIDSQTDPCVTVSVVHDDERRSVIQLVIKNIGTGIARDINFEPSRPIPHKAWGIAPNKENKFETMHYGPLVDGIPVLGPGEERKIDWGQLGGLKQALGQEPIIVKCKFYKGKKLMPTVECKLHVKSFEGTVANEKPIVTIAKQLEKVSCNLEHVITGSKKLHVELTVREELPE